MTSYTVIQTAVAVLLLIAALAGVVGYFRANISQATIDLYKEDNAALRTRLDSLQAENRSNAAKILALQDANKFLGQVVTQADNIAYIKTAVDRLTDKVDRIIVVTGA